MEPDYEWENVSDVVRVKLRSMRTPVMVRHAHTGMNGMVVKCPACQPNPVRMATEWKPALREAGNHPTKANASKE